MSKTANRYAKAARKKQIMGLGSTPMALAKKGQKMATKKINYKEVLQTTGKDLVIGGIGGGLAGTLLGRYSFLAGILVTGIAHAMGSPAAAGFGIGMMASGGFQGMNPFKGTDGVNGSNGTDGLDGIEGLKERFDHYKENLKRQFFVDKLASMNKENVPKNNSVSKGALEQSTNGLDAVDYYRGDKSAEEQFNGANDLDLTEINRIEAQLEQSARQYAQKQNKSNEVSGMDDGSFDNINGTDGLDDDTNGRLM